MGARPDEPPIVELALPVCPAPPFYMRVVTWDIEIAQPIEETPGGWEGARRGDAGISCVCLYDTTSGRTHVYDEHDLEECSAHLNSADMLVGFNTLSFDTPVMESVVGYSVLTPQYDILSLIWKELGTRHKGYRLADICERLQLGEKNGNGESAPNLYRKGRFGRLFDYCINDVHLTRKLANWINDNGYILTPEREPIPIPQLGAEA